MGKPWRPEGFVPALVMRLSIAFARSTFIAIPNERGVKSLLDDLVTKRGVVSGRLALLRGSTETQPPASRFDPTLIRNCNESAPRKSYTQTHNKRRARSLPAAMASNLEAFS